MSHFSVLVIGDDIDDQLSPYHEFECTGFDDQYVQNVNVLPNLLKDFQDYNKRHPEDASASLAEFIPDWCGLKLLEPGGEPEIDGEHKYGWFRVDDEGNVAEAIDRTNPNAKWNWYQVGGRWSKFLKDAHGNFVSTSRKGDIDWNGMMDAAEEKARKEINSVNAILSPGEIQLHRTWDQVREACTDGKKCDIDLARKLYHAQPTILALNRSEEFKHKWDFDELLRTDHDQWIMDARRDAVRTFAYVKNSEWFQKGRMGWFGTSTDEMPEDAWRDHFEQMLNSLPDDTIVTIVDCHI